MIHTYCNMSRINQLGSKGKTSWAEVVGHHQGCFHPPAPLHFSPLLRGEVCTGEAWSDENGASSWMVWVMVWVMVPTTVIPI